MFDGPYIRLWSDYLCLIFPTSQTLLKIGPICFYLGIFRQSNILWDGWFLLHPVYNIAQTLIKLRKKIGISTKSCSSLKGNSINVYVNTIYRSRLLSRTKWKTNCVQRVHHGVCLYPFPEKFSNITRKYLSFVLIIFWVKGY